MNVQSINEQFKIAYVSLGCKVNLYESMAIIDEFVNNGFILVSNDELADVYIVNTCTVTQTSDSKSRKKIRELARLNPNAILCVMGCYSQLNPEEALDIDGVNIVTGTSNRNKLYEEVINLLQTKEYDKKIDLSQSYDDISCYEELKINKFYDRTRGFVKIQDGCENFCSYCAIPYSRGKFRSRDKDNIIQEIQKLTDDGIKEIVLTGINTGAYGFDLDNYNFANLLTDLCEKVNNLGRLRISSIEATEVNDELLQVMKKYEDHFCMHLHIPIQSATDEVLKLMSRKYDLAFYKNVIKNVRSYFPLINITSDILTGFDGETDELFKEGLENIRSIEYGETHVFPYSPRSNTKAYKLSKENKHKYDVNDLVKKYRVSELLSLNEINSLKYRELFLDKEVCVLVERIKDGFATGHSSNYLEIKFKVKNAKVNDFVVVKITKVGYPTSMGEEVYVK